LLHSVVLLTPVIPLVAFAAEGSTGDTTGRNHALAVAGKIVALSLALMRMWSPLSQVRSPVSILYRALDNLVIRHLGVTFRSWRHSSGSSCGCWPLSPGSCWSCSRSRFSPRPSAAWCAVEWIDLNAVQWKNARFWLITVAAALTIVGLAVGYWTGWRLRSWSVRRTDSGTVYEISAVTHARGVAAN
jgi:hypothetical protein